MIKIGRTWINAHQVAHIYQDNESYWIVSLSDGKKVGIHQQAVLNAIIRANGGDRTPSPAQKLEQEQ